MKIVVFGAGVQGTLYGVRLAAAGHDVTLVARGDRAKELRDKGAVIQDAMTGRTNLMNLPVVETLLANTTADLGLVFVRREQISQALPALTAAVNVQRFVFMFNHANGSEFLFHAIGRKRVVLGFPGAGGSIEEGVDRYVDIPEQGTVIQSAAPEVASPRGLSHQAGGRHGCLAQTTRCYDHGDRRGNLREGWECSRGVG
jgi:ketopantoate reductase